MWITCFGQNAFIVLRLLWCCFPSTETVRTTRDRESRTSTSYFIQFLGNVFSVVSVMSTETVRTTKDKESRTSTSSFVQLLNKVFSVVSRPQRPYRLLGTKEPRTSTSSFAQLLSSDKSAVRVQCCFLSTETVRTVGGHGVQDGHLDFHTAPEI